MIIVDTFLKLLCILDCQSDKTFFCTGTLDIFDKTLTIKLVRNKLEVSDTLAAKDFKYGAADRDYLLEWLYKEMMGIE